MKLNEKIKSNRIRLGLTQEELANKINVTRQTISKYELGTNVPDVFTLKLLANIFNLSVDELLDDNDNFKLLRKKKILFYISLSIIVFGIFSHLAMITFMDEVIPIHFDINFNADRYSTKYELCYFLLILLIPLIINILFYFGFNKFKISTYLKEKHKLLFEIFGLISSALFTIIILVIDFIIFNKWAEYYPNIITSFLSIIFCIISFFSTSQFNKEQNIIFGYKTSFSLKSKQNWTILNNICGYSILICSIISYLLSLFIIFIAAYVFLLIVFVGIIITVLAEIILRLKEKSSLNGNK